MSNKKFNVKFCVLLPIVLIVTVFLWAVPTSFYGVEALTIVQQRVIALFVFAALMWIFEIIPNWTTSILVIVLSLLTISDKGLGFLCYPEAGRLIPYANIMAAFADPVVMLFLGGFTLAIMAQKYCLDVTLAKALLKPFGSKPRWVLLGFLLVIAVFSMFMSNTATAAMMLALLAPVLAALPADDKGKVGLALSIPVAANLGGIGTTIGTPPNATAVRFLSQAGIEVSDTERNLLLLEAAGCTASEISSKLGESDKAIQERQKDLSRRLDIVNKSAARVAKALSLGLIAPTDIHFLPRS